MDINCECRLINARYSYTRGDKKKKRTKTKKQKKISEHKRVKPGSDNITKLSFISLVGHSAGGRRSCFNYSPRHSEQLRAS